MWSAWKFGTRYAKPVLTLQRRQQAAVVPASKGELQPVRWRASETPLWRSQSADTIFLSDPLIATTAGVMLREGSTRREFRRYLP